MGRISNGTITVLNTLTFLISVSAIGFSLWFHVKPESPCQRVLKTPLLAIGVSLLVVSVAGLVGSCCRIWLVMWLYLFVLFLLIVGLIAFTVFTIIVTNRGVGTALSRRGVGDHRLGDYSGWLHKYVVNADNWDEIKSCLVDVNLCGKIEGGKAEDYYKHKLSPILSGCCKPPSYCGFEFVNATYWTMPKTGQASVTDPDCKAWSNEQKEVCFECDSCKTAVLVNIKGEWRVLALINIGILVVVIGVYSVGCCALRNNHYDDYGKRRGR